MPQHVDQLSPITGSLHNLGGAKPHPSISWPTEPRLSLRSPGYTFPAPQPCRASGMSPKAPGSPLGHMPHFMITFTGRIS